MSTNKHAQEFSDFRSRPKRGLLRLLLPCDEMAPTRAYNTDSLLLLNLKRRSRRFYRADFYAARPINNQSPRCGFDESFQLRTELFRRKAGLHVKRC